MALIPIREIPGGVVAAPLPTDRIAIDNGTAMQQTTLENAVNASVPVASQAEAQAGADNLKRMTALRTKQSIASEVGVTLASVAQGALADTAVQSVNGITGSAVVIAKADVGLGNADNTSDLNKPISNATQTALDLKADTADLGDLAYIDTVNDANWSGADLSIENGGTGSSTAAAARTALGVATTAQGALADSAIQPGDQELVPAGGSSGQILSKTSGADFATGWVTNSASSAVSYAPQTLTAPEQEQARSNIGVNIGRSYAEYTANTNLTASIPVDDTIPQITEGTEILSVTITPKTTTNKLRIRFQGQVSISPGPGAVTVAFFDGASNAIAAKYIVGSSTDTAYDLTLEAEYTPGVTTTKTITARIGPNSGTLRLNGSATGGRVLGGASKATLVVEEIRA